GQHEGFERAGLRRQVDLERGKDRCIHASDLCPNVAASRPLYAETGNCQNRSCCRPIEGGAMIARAPLGEILRHLRGEPSPTWSVIITVFGDAIVPRGGSVWLGTLVRFFAALGINDGVVRTAMSRLAADGWLERSRVGRNSFYHLTKKGRVTFKQATAHIYGARARRWNGRFEILLVGNARERESVRPQLLAAGFGPAARGFWVPPAGTPVPRLTREALHLDAGCDLATARKLAKQCWPLERTAGAYARFLTLFTPLQAALEAAMPLAGIDAFVARI